MSIVEKIALIGAKGNMGKRYAAIMDYYMIPYVSFDIENYDELPRKIDAIKSFIVATPTNTHFKILSELKNYNLPILCEKAITKNKQELDKILNYDIKLAMVNQYAFLVRDCESKNSISYYDYYKSGGDGLIWDCINIIGLSINWPDLNNYSPIWKCCINGNILSLSGMDLAYIQMIQQWHLKPWEDKDYIYNVHEKVFKRIQND